MRNRRLKKVHDVVTTLSVLFWVNWAIYLVVTASFLGGYESNHALSKPNQGVYIASKRDKTIQISEQRFRFHLGYWAITWILWLSSWPLLAASHFIGKRLDRDEPPPSREEFLQTFKDEQIQSQHNQSLHADALRSVRSSLPFSGG
jgi:hypothetical protein